MKLDEQILNRLREMVKAPYLVFPAEVKEVDKSTLSCTVLPLDGVEMFDVRLKAGVENITEGLLEIPAVNSSVLIVLIGNSAENAFVAKCSLVEEVLFYGGDNGGLIRVNELVSQLEKVTNYLKAINGAFMAPVPVSPGDGGTALAAHVFAQLSAEQLPDYSKIENPKVKH